MTDPTTTTTDDDFDVEEVVSTARDDFDLGSFLADAPKYTDTVTVYRDAKAGAKFGGVEAEELFGGIRSGERRWGLLGELADLTDQVKAALGDESSDTKAVTALEKAIKAKKAEIKKAAEELRESALVFQLQAVPDVIVEGCRRKARRDLRIKNKNIPDSMDEEYNRQLNARLLEASVIEYHVNAAGKTLKGLTVPEALSLQKRLPFGEYPKLIGKINTLSFKNAIGKNSTSDVDF